MAKHSKWAQIKRQKEVMDKKRGQAFTKLTRAITLAVAQGGGDPAVSASLRLAIDRALSANMPKDNITRAIDRAISAKTTGAAAVFEAYGPSGSAFMIFTLTDNRNRTVAEIRALLLKNGGTLASSGSVAWQFEPRGVITIAKKHASEDVELKAIEQGASDIQRDAEELRIITSPPMLEAVSAALRAAHIPIGASEIANLPKQTITLTESDRAVGENLVRQLQNHPDVIKVVTNIQGM